MPFRIVTLNAFPPLTHVCPAVPTHSCANIAGDGDSVDVTDLLALLAGYGGPDTSSDINNDGATDVSDLLLLLAQYGSSCTRSAGNQSGDCVFNYVDSAALSFLAAEDHCITNYGGHLASAHSQADGDIIEQLTTGDTAWIGYHDMGFEAGCTDDRHAGIGGEIAAVTFVWTDASPSDYENWADGEPNDWQDGAARCDGTGNEDCAEAWNSGASWNDAACDGQKAFVCARCPTRLTNPTTYQYFTGALSSRGRVPVHHPWRPSGIIAQPGRPRPRQRHDPGRRDCMDRLPRPL